MDAQYIGRLSNGNRKQRREAKRLTKKSLKNKK